MGDRLGGGNEECQDQTCDEGNPTAIKRHVLLQIKTELNNVTDRRIIRPMNGPVLTFHQQFT